MNEIGNLYRTTIDVNPFSGKLISAGTLVKVTEVLRMNNTAEVMCQDGFRYIVDAYFSGGFETVDRSYLGRPNYIFSSPSAEPIIEKYDLNFDEIREEEEFVATNSFVVRAHGGMLQEVGNHELLVVSDVSNNDVEFISIHLNISFRMSYEDMKRFGLRSTREDILKEKSQKKDHDYILYLRTFIHIKSGAVFDMFMLENEYSEHELVVIATAVADSKLGSYPQRKADFSTEWLEGCIN
jgi:hypothetical protein